LRNLSIMRIKTRERDRMLAGEDRGEINVVIVYGLLHEDCISSQPQP
jgi:hypothetical protein